MSSAALDYLPSVGDRAFRVAAARIYESYLMEQFTPARQLCTFVACLPVTPQDSVFMSPLRRHIRLLHGKIGILEGFFGPSSVHRGRTHIVLG